MKKIIKIIIVALLLSSCGQNTQDKAQIIDETIHSQGNRSTITDFTKSFEGTINNKYNIIMTLTKSEEELSGTYTYKSQGAPLKISGTIDVNGNLTINEFNNKGSMTGIFKGQLSNNTIIGQWTKPDGSKTMPFSISESTNTETSIVKIEASNTNDYSNWTGTYEDGYGTTMKIQGPASDGAVRFEIIQVSASCEAASIDGTAYIKSSTVANYYQKEDGTCHLNFTYNQGQIELKEYDCMDFHGAACGLFEGFYKKKK